MAQPLYTYLSEKLNSIDLQLLSAELHVDFDDLSGSSKTLKLLSLQQYLGNRSRLNELLVKLSSRPDLDLKPYLYLVIAEAFPTEEAITRLLHHFGLTVRNFGGPEKFSWGSEAWREQKAQALQDYMASRNLMPELLTAIRQLNPTVDLTFMGDVTSQPIGQGSPEFRVTTEPKQLNRESERDEYFNFDIRLGTPQEGRYPITVDSDFGETLAPVWQLFPSQDILGQTIFLRNLVGRPEDAQQLGRKLHEFLFPSAVWNLFGTSLARAQTKGKRGIRIRLRIGSDLPEMSQVPWEYCHDDRSFVALNKATPLVRYLPTDNPPEPISIPGTLRLLLVMASPTDQTTQIDVIAEEQRVRQALSPFIASNRIELKVLPHASRRELYRQVTAFDPHVLHFLGHGVLQSNGEGALVLENANQSSELVTAQDLYVLLQSSSIKLVILSACETAAHDQSEVFMGVAPRLVLAGVPAVIAMQFQVPYQTAVAFTHDLYDFLVQGKPLDMAVTEARIGAYFDDKVFWAIPVLFMRAPDGVIWKAN